MKISLLIFSLPVATFAATDTFFYHDSFKYGPSKWGSFPIDSNMCSGQKNSPINIVTGGCDKNANYLVLNGDCGIDDMEFTITDHGLKGTFKDGCSKNQLRIPDVEGTFEALQFHIHSSSEHTMDGNKFGAELHIVHKQVNGDRYAVVGMMIEPQRDSAHNMFTPLIQGWEDVSKKVEAQCGVCNGSDDRRLVASTIEDENELRRMQSNYNIYDMLPPKSSFYHYDGSLTTPPCSEVVWWNVVDVPVEVSINQYASLIQLILNYRDERTCAKSTVASPSGSTSRPVQPLNGRSVTRICAVEEGDDSEDGEEKEEEESKNPNVDRGNVTSSSSTLGLSGIVLSLVLIVSFVV